MSEENLNISDFTRVDVGGAVEVEVVQSSTYGVKVYVENFEVKDVKVLKEGDKLKIGRKVTPKSIVLAPLARIKVSVNMPEIHELKLTGASRGTIRGFKSAHDFTLNVNGASHLEVEAAFGAIKVDLSGASHVTGKLAAGGDSEFRLSGASHLTLDGSAKDVVIDASGASHVKLRSYKSNNVSIKLSGASHSEINLDGKLDANLSGASNLVYTGNPTIGNMKITNASSFEKA